LSSAPPQQTSQNQQILDLFAGSSPVPAPKQSALDDLLSLGLGSSNGTNGTSMNGSNAFGAPASSNPFADMFSSAPQQQQKVGYGGNGFAPMGMQMGMGAPQQQFYQQAPTIQQPFGDFGSNSDQGKI
jgi:hypothetical protein